jgi:hypothetical protein
MSYWPRLCSNASEDCDKIPPGAKKSCSEGSLSGGAGAIEMGAVVDKVRIALYGGEDTAQFL